MRTSAKVLLAVGIIVCLINSLFHLGFPVNYVVLEISNAIICMIAAYICSIVANDNVYVWKYYKSIPYIFMGLLSGTFYFIASLIIANVFCDNHVQLLFVTIVFSMLLVILDSLIQKYLH